MDDRQKAGLLTSCNASPSLSRDIRLDEWILSWSWSWWNFCKRTQCCSVWMFVTGLRRTHSWIFKDLELPSSLSHPFSVLWAWRRVGVRLEPERAPMFFVICTKAWPKLYFTLNHPGTTNIEAFCKVLDNQQLWPSAGFCLNSSSTVKRTRCSRLYFAVHN